MFDIELELKKLPNKPGVYLMKDKENNIIYVGKAVVLKNRVRQYFRKNNKTKRIEKMVSLIDHFEYIVTDSEEEALILECNLIKENRPKFNVLLKDDKTYPYIRVDVKSKYPTVYMTRKLANDGAKYFGPYANATAVKEMVKLIKDKFRIRQCKNFKSNTRVCLNYHINKCSGPCMNLISEEDYKEQINQIMMLLDGKVDGVKKKLREELEVASKKLEFEKAAEIRDRILAIDSLTETQKVSNININNIDVIGVYKNEMSVVVEIFFVRGSKMIGREHYFFEELKEMETKEILSGFLKQYYMNRIDLPNKIMIGEEIEEKEILEKLLEKQAGRKVEIKVPQKGEKLRFVEMAERNAKITLENRYQDDMEILTELKEVLQLEKLPKKIESFDISNISGNYIVAGMCVAMNGKIKRNLSRRFQIKTVFGQDDPRCMEEVITRRIKHSIDHTGSGFGTIPDLILADGGITQIRAIQKAVAKYEITIPVYGMVKNDKHQTRALIDENRNEFEISQNLKNFITNLQDEVHKTAIEYHRKIRDKNMVKSQLDEIEGVGDKKREALLKEFKTIENIKKAEIEELMKVKGIHKSLAEKIKEELR